MIVVRDNDFRMEGFDRVRGFVRRHGIGQIHANESDIDILEGAHFGNAFGIAGNVKAFTAIGEDVTVAATLVVVELACFRTALQVVHRDRFDRPAGP